MQRSTMLLLLISGYGCHPTVVDPPSTIASPEESGLVIVRADVRAVRNSRTGTLEKNVSLTGGRVQREGDDRKLIGGYMVQDVLVFSHLPAGVYHLKHLIAPAVTEIRTNYPVTIGERPGYVGGTKAVSAGNQITYVLPRQIKTIDETAFDLTFAVEPGKLVYIGRIKVTDNLTTDETNLSSRIERNNTFAIETHPIDEILAWETILKEHSGNAWTGRIEDRLRKLNAEL